MSRRPALRPADIMSVAGALTSRGIVPLALDILPDGTHRWHFKPPNEFDEAALDRELAAFDKKHGHG